MDWINWKLVWHWMPEVLIAIALMCLFDSLIAARRRLLVDNLPTSKTSGVFMGLVELKGTAEGEGMRSHLAGVQCVYYRYTVREKVSETDTDSEGRSTNRTSWETVAQGGVDTVPFFLKDDKGEVRIQPKGAQVELQTVLDRKCGPSDSLYHVAGVKEKWGSQRVREFKEEVIRLHSRIYVVGHARQRHDTVAAEIAEDKHAPLFLISTRSEEKVSSRLRWQFWLVALLGAVLSGLSVYVRGIDLQPGSPPSVAGITRAAFVFLGTWFLGWLLMLFNSLVDLRQRVNKAWANIDVEIKRRADLLPNLVRMVTAVAEHEKMAQPLLAALRAQAGATAPGAPGPDPVALGKPVRLLAEAYPALKANTAYLKLQKQLAETEDRIALARGYFNEIATFYNTRISSFPDGFLAGLVGMRERRLMDAAGFERAPAQLAKHSTYAGPCPRCQADVYARKGLRFCPFCGKEGLKAPAAGMPAQCGGCGGFMKPFSATDDRLAGKVVHCGGCGFKLPVAKID